MKITALEIENFLSVGDAKLALDDRGLVHISGENHDDTSANSNGSGKSSIADAVSWCLWGSTARGEGGDNVVNLQQNKNCRVAIELEEAGEHFRVTRYRKYTKHKNALHVHKLDNGDWVDLTKGTNTLTQAVVERIMGCSEEVFNAAVYSGQEAMPDLPAMTDKHLKLLVEQAAGVDVYSRAYDIARERLRDAQTRRANAQIDHDRADELHIQTMSHIQRAVDAEKTWNGTQQGKIKALTTQATELAAQAKVLKESINVDDEKDLKATIAATEAKIASVRAEQERERELAATAKQTSTTRAGANSRVEIAAGTLRLTDKAVKAVEQSEGKPCGECGKPFEKADLEQARKLAEAKRTDAADQYKQAKAKLAIAEKLDKDAATELEKHRAGMTDVSEETSRLSNLQRELGLIENQHREVARLAERARDALQQRKQAQAETNPHTPLITDMERELKEHAATRAAAKEKFKAASSDHEYAAAVVEVYAPAGVRAHRLDEATPYLNERTAHYLGSLADGAIEAYWTTLTLSKNGKDLQEKFSIAVEKPGKSPSFASLSGGEKRKVRLACALALQDLVASRATKSLGIWIGDEIDDALDAAGLERLMGVLEEKARERGTVLVISHNDIAHYARQEIRVEKRNDISTVTVL